jgi:hypothetical protein
MLALVRALFAVSTVAVALVACSASPDGGGDPNAADPGSPASPSPSPSTSGDDGGPSSAVDAGAHADAATHSDAPTHADAKPDVAPKPDAGDTGGCPAVTYPSGAKIQMYKDAATTASYANHLGAGESAPQCFLDADRLFNPDTGETYALTVKVATNFGLDELVGTEIAQGYGHFVLVTPSAVAALQKFREEVSTAVSVNSGFRSPKHQEAVCNSLCGNPLGCPGTCANNSRHMFGDAFDLPLAFYTATDEQLACNAGFKFAYLESGTHLHIDQNPAYATCVKQ